MNKATSAIGSAKFIVTHGIVLTKESEEILYTLLRDKSFKHSGDDLYTYHLHKLAGIAIVNQGSYQRLCPVFANEITSLCPLFFNLHRNLEINDAKISPISVNLLSFDFEEKIASLVDEHSWSNVVGCILFRRHLLISPTDNKTSSVNTDPATFTPSAKKAVFLEQVDRLAYPVVTARMGKEKLQRAVINLTQSLLTDMAGGRINDLIETAYVTRFDGYTEPLVLEVDVASQVCATSFGNLKITSEFVNRGFHITVAADTTEASWIERYLSLIQSDNLDETKKEFADSMVKRITDSQYTIDDNKYTFELLGWNVSATFHSIRNALIIVIN